MQCTATRRNGQPCGSHAVKGANVCRMHGGSAPQVRKAAQNRTVQAAAHAQAERMVARAGTNADPIEHLLDSLHLSAALVAVWGHMVAGLDAHAAQLADTHGYYRGMIGYSENTDEDTADELHVVSHDTLLTLNRAGMAQVHPYVSEYNQALDRRARFAKLCLDAGVQQRQMDLAERYAQQVAQLLNAVYDDLGVPAGPERAAKMRGHLTLVSSTSRAV